MGGRSGVLAAVQLVTNDGLPVAGPEQRVYFDLQGAGRLLVNQGTPTGTRVVTTANGRAAIRLLDPGSGDALPVTAEGLPVLRLDLDQARGR